MMSRGAWRGGLRAGLAVPDSEPNFLVYDVALATYVENPEGSNLALWASAASTVKWR